MSPNSFKNEHVSEFVITMPKYCPYCGRILNRNYDKAKKHVKECGSNPQPANIPIATLGKAIW